MSRRTVLLGGLLAAISLMSSTGCCGYRPFLCRWNCGGCWPQCYNPPAVGSSAGPVVSSPVMAGPVCSPCSSGPIMGGGMPGPILGGGVNPSECSCFSPPTGPIAISSPAPVSPPVSVLNTPAPTYAVPPPVFSGQPSTLIAPPQVMKENPMPNGGSK